MKTRSQAPQFIMPPKPTHKCQRFSPAVAAAVVDLQDAAERLAEAERAATILPPSWGGR